ncbi:MarR family winged helix-turn-helix transcriptional regulator [Qipengyuania sp. ASV99]|uniref:MarR family winged helix-turn-helix transcriptional regulator n=1 Tax=Qipengyuania sp. ASV99 TaxID=3399681 RepID=UPI003A4C761B
MNDMTQSASARSAKGSQYQLSGFLPYQLSITSNAVSGLIAERYRKRFGLKITEWRVMAVLGDAGLAGARLAGAGKRSGGGRLTQRDLTELTLMDKVAVNRACKVLEERGLVQRAANVADGRSHLLELTDEGEAIHREVMPLARATERELFEGFAAEEEALLRTMLQRMRERAGMLARGPDG